MPTIKDVAALAGVSIATVSNYLNHTHPVSHAAAARIQQAVDQLQYAANLSARNLRSNRYTEVGVILPDLNDPYYVQIFQGVERAFSGTPYFVNVAFSYDIPELERSIAEGFLNKQVCGLILISCIPDDGAFYVKSFLQRGKVLVMIDRKIRDVDANYVTVDYETVVERLTAQLLQEGYQAPVLMAGPVRFTCEAACIRGFSKACPNGSMVQTDLNRESAFRTTMAMLRTQTPQVVVATSESVASGIMEALALSGCGDGSVPVVTLGEEHWNKVTHSFADFSTARPAIRMGQTAAELLLSQMETHGESRQVVLQDGSVRQGKLFSRLERPAASGPRGSVKLLLLESPAVDTLLNLLPNFTCRTGIEVQVRTLAHHKLSREILLRPTGERYDVIMYDIPWLPMLASRGILQDITDWLQGVDTGIFFPGCLQDYSFFRDRAFGVPFVYAPQIFFYRKDLFERTSLRESFERTYGLPLRPPITLKEYNTVGEFFTRKTDVIPYGMSVAAAYPECLAPELYTRMKAYGGSVFSPSGKVVLNTPENFRAYENLLEALQVAKPDFLQATDMSIISDFLSGETAMLIGYPAFMTDVADLRKNSMLGSIGYSLIPGRAPLLGGWGLGLDAACEERENALAFLKWMCDEQVGNYFALMGGQTTITSSYTNDELVKLYPWLPMYYSAYESATPTRMPELPGGRVLASEDVDDVVCRWLYEAIRNGLPLRDAMDATACELEKLVRDTLR